MLEILRKRQRLSETDEREWRIQRAGYEGERRFAALVKQHLSPEAQVMYSVLLQTDHNFFQIDCMIIVRGEIYVIDLKNYRDDYVYQDGDFHVVKSKQKIKNPLHQLQRCEDLLRDFLHQRNMPYNVHGFIAFIHPEFMLYQAPLHLPVIHPGQTRRFLEKINQTMRRGTAAERKVAHLFREQHIKVNPFAYVPSYSYRALKKGVLCLRCAASMRRQNKALLVCSSCGATEAIASGMLRALLDFTYLFPDTAITAQALHHWVDALLPLKYIRRLLQRYLIKAGDTRPIAYEFVE